MPVGVPKVQFYLEGDEDYTWVDLYNALYRSRLLFLVEEIDEEIINQIVGLIIFINTEGGSDPITLYINSEGGSIYGGLAIYDIMQSSIPSVHTCCIGMAASMASVILAGGQMLDRGCFQNSRIMIHQPLAEFDLEGQAAEFSDDTNIVLQLRLWVTHIYRRRTGKSLLTISHDLERDLFMSAYEAIDYGIADQIVTNDNVDFYIPMVDYKKIYGWTVPPRSDEESLQTDVFPIM